MHLKKQCWKSNIIVIKINIIIVFNKNFIIQVKNALKIIEFNILIFFKYDHDIAFRDYQHIKINARLFFNAIDIEICLNLNYFITLDDRILLFTFSNFEERVRK